MAEFQEVMKQARRMCEQSEGRCEDCPLQSIEYCAITSAPCFVDAETYKKIERTVMDWAANHPEAMYPSWNEAWKQLFPDGQRTPCPGCCGRKYAPEWCGQEECGECKNRPIPADIAEKLGIKPMGGSQ